MANQTNNKNQQNDKSLAESIKNADWSAFQKTNNNLETTENVTENTFDANDKSLAENIKNADWSAFQKTNNNLEIIENVTGNTFDADLTGDTNPNRIEQ